MNRGSCLQAEPTTKVFVTWFAPILYSVDCEVWSKLAERAHIKRTASKCALEFDCDWEVVNVFSHCVTLTCVLLQQIISYSDTKVPVLVVMKNKRASVLYVCELIFLLHTSRSTEYSFHSPSFGYFPQPANIRLRRQVLEAIHRKC